MLQKTKAIVLHSVKYGESSLIVHCMTEEWGRQSFLLKGVRKSKKNNRSNLYQPLFLLDLDVYYKESRTMQWIKEAGFVGAVPNFYFDMVKSTQAIFITELLMKVLREEEKNSMLFHFLEHSLSYLESLETPSPAFHILFIFQLSRFLGFYPRNNYSEKAIFFNPEKGGFYDRAYTGNLEQETVLGRLWHLCSSQNYTSVDQIFTNHEDRNLFLDSLLNFYRLQSESFGELKSLDVLRTVFAEN